MDVTKDFQKFIDAVDMDFHEVYDLYAILSSEETARNSFSKKKAMGSTEDILIIYEPTKTSVRLTPKAAEYFPEWIQINLMNGEDPEIYYEMEYQIDKDPELKKFRNRNRSK